MRRLVKGYRAVPLMATTGACCANRVTNLGTASKDDVLNWCHDCKCFYKRGEVGAVTYLTPILGKPPKTNTFGQVIE